MERRKVSKSKNGGLVRRFIITNGMLHRLYRRVIDIVYPNICPCCEEIIAHDDDFCDKCTSTMTLYEGNFQVKNADCFVAYCMYEGKIRYAVRKFKYDSRGNSYYAFAFGIVQALRRQHIASEIDEVVYIPMTKADLMKRGYNQTKLIAKEIHYLLEIPCTDALIKTRSTMSQKSMKSSTARTENVKDVFAISRKGINLKGKCVLVVDDLCTTGSTLSEAARVLKEAGAQKVIAASFAKTNNGES